MDRPSVAISLHYLTKYLNIEVIQEFPHKVQHAIEKRLPVLKGVLLRIYQWFWNILLLVQQAVVSLLAILIEVSPPVLKGVLLRIHQLFWNLLLKVYTLFCQVASTAECILRAIGQWCWRGIQESLSQAYSKLLGLRSCVLWLTTFVLWRVPCCLLFICCPCLFMYWILRLRSKQDPKCSNEDKPSAKDAVNDFLSNNRRKYTSPAEMNCLGSRLHKQWYKAQTREADVLITAALVSQNCPLKLTASTLQGINELLTTFKPHPFLHWVLEVSYDRDFQHVIIVQEHVSEGSLKDMIYRKADADADWSEKYRRRSKGLPNKTVMLYGRQILEAIMYLYRCGFPYHQLGHVQTGNVFVGAGDNTCLLGGYENTLLGYKTRLFRLCRQYEDRIDIVMFGHMLFEMCCGYELTTCRPKKQDYKSVKDKLLKSTLQYIFEEGFPHSIEEISKKQCFKDQQIQLPQDQRLSQKCQSLLEELRMSAPQQQDPPRTGRKKPLSLL